MRSRDPGLHDQGTWRTFLRVGGLVLLGLGIILTAITLIGFFSAFGSFGSPGMPGNFWMAFLGLPLIGLGSTMLKAGYLGPASRYVAGEVSPTLRDTLGFVGVTSTALCPACGARNADDAKFCDDCGAALRRICPACNAANAADAKFCDDCGAAVSRPS